MSDSKSRLEKFRQLIKQDKEKKGNNGGGKRGNIYPFWLMDNDEKAVVRILPDKNEDNPFIFYVEKLEHKLSINGKDKNVPCLQMYVLECQIVKLSTEFYKTEGDKSPNGKYYYRNKSALLRVLVIEDPLAPDPETKEKATGKVLNTQFSYQLMEKIKEEVGSGDLGDDVLPCDLKNGYDFIIKKTKQGSYGKYDVGSGFARRPSSLSDEVIESLELIDLSTLLPKNPGYEFVEKQLHAHLSGDDSGDGEDEKEEPTKTEEPQKKVTEEPRQVVAQASATTDSSDDDDDDGALEAIIRARRQRSGK